MKIKLSLLLAVLILSQTKSKLLAQSCDGFSTSTFASTTAVWDWRNASPSNWGAYVRTASSAALYVELPSPYVNSVNPEPNCDHLYETSITPDYQPSEGWELVYKGFGLALTLAGSAQNPGFVMYNRFRGIMRIFLFVRNDVGTIVNDAFLKIEFANLGKESGLLAYTDAKSFALQHFQKEVKSSSMQAYQNCIGGCWMMMDLPVAYDPCTCTKSLDAVLLTDNNTRLRVEGKLLSSANINLVSNTLPIAPVASAGTATSSNSFKSLFDSFDGALKKGNKTSKDYASYLTTFNQTMTILDPQVKGETGLILKPGWKMPDWLKQLPQIGVAFGVIDFMVTGGKTTDKTNATVPASAKTNYTGSIGLEGDIVGYTFNTPGCPIAPLGGYSKPIYDYVLGIFNVLETPKLEYVRYYYNSSEPTLVSNNACVVVDHPQIDQFRLKEPLKYVINPASELQLVDMEIAIDYVLNDNHGGSAVPTYQMATGPILAQSTCPGVPNKVLYPMLGPVVYQNINADSNFVNGLQQAGVQVSNWPKAAATNPAGIDNINKMTFSTGYFAAGCWNERSIAYAHHPINESATYSYSGDKDLFYKKPEFYVRVKAILRRTDAHATAATEDIVFIATYKANTSESLLNHPFSNNPTAANTYKYSINTLNIDENTWNPIERYKSNYHVLLSKKNTPGVPVFAIDNQQLPYNFSYNTPTAITANKKVLNNLYINSNLTTSIPGGVVLEAGNEIIIKPGAVVAPNIILRTTEIFSCSSTALAQVPYATVMANCQNQSLYNPNTGIRKPELPVYDTVPQLAALYPNPCSDILIILINENYIDPLDLVVLNSIGQEVLQAVSKPDAGKIHVDVSALPNGFYIIKLRDASINFKAKFIVSR